MPVMSSKIGIFIVCGSKMLPYLYKPSLK